MSMSDQLYIAPDGSLQPEPRTWDGEPLYSPSTVQEGLFDPFAFEQISGQMEIVPACRADDIARWADDGGAS